MPIDDKVKIQHPRRFSRRDSAVPLDFFAVGTAKGSTIRSVRGSIKLANNTGSSVNGTTKFFRSNQPGGSRYFWVIRFTGVAAGLYRLKVVGLDKDDNQIAGCDDKVRFEAMQRGVDLRAAPSIDYPPNTKPNIIDERDYFVAYGPTGGQPVTEAKVTPTSPPGDAVYGAVDEVGGYWIATFDLSMLEPDIETLELQVTNSAGTATREVCILA